MLLYFRREVLVLSFFLLCTVSEARRSACSNGVCGFQQMPTCGIGGCGFRSFSVPEVPALPGIQIAVRPELDEAFGTRDYWIPRMQNSPTGMKHIRLDNQGWVTFVDNQRILRRLGRDANGQVVVRNNNGGTVALSAVSPEGAKELEALMAARNPANAVPANSANPSLASSDANVLGAAQGNASGHSGVVADTSPDVGVIDSAGSWRSGSRSASRSPNVQPATTNPQPSPASTLAEKTEEEVSGPEWTIECRVADGVCFATHAETGEVVRVKKKDEASTQTKTEPPKEATTPALNELEITNMRDYTSLKKSGGKVVVLTFGFPGCPSCDQLDPVLTNLKRKTSGVTFAHVNTNNVPDVVNFFGQNGASIRFVPKTFIMAWDPNSGWYQTKNHFTGATTERDLQSKIQNALSSTPMK